MGHINYGSRAALCRAVLAEYARQALVLRDAITRRQLTSAMLIRLDTAWLEVRIRLQLLAEGGNPDDRARMPACSRSVGRRLAALAEQLAVASREVN